MLLDMLADNPILVTSLAGLLGLLVGSFLNVVIHRLPIMLERSWRNECRAFLQLEAEHEEPKPYNLVFPGSTCPQCSKPIAPWENIPVISYILLRGRCSGCGTAISPRYPAIESLTALVSAAVAWRYGAGAETVAGLGLSWALICLSAIDFDRQILPDAITLPTLWAGLVLSLFGVFADSHASILGAVFGYTSLWSVYQVFRLTTGKEGMGYGDFKLLAMLGAWLGWSSLPAIVLLSSLVGAVVGIAMIAFRRHDRNVPIPFGPYLAAAGWLTLIWGKEINAAYLRFAAVPG